ncbi:YhzD family protein [Alkalihalobacillus sp. CinArs1]|uniref:YhzD family protein n=1 Tax=Alkalihalobacillus sp. CinArs1 TaxID=2995314 RepID=UPI0022DDE6D5|nr:YhzD family protein [Alkalihalobacillus sp. CinArs1]
MEKYIITAFEKDGTTILDDSFEAQNDKDAKKIGQEILNEKGFESKPARVVSSTGKLIVLQR